MNSKCVFMNKVLRLVAVNNLESSLLISVDENDNVQFSIVCNDLFFYASADAVEINEENFHLLEKAVETLPDESDSYFCCLVRQMRPQNGWFDYISRDKWDLFLACGPERSIDFSNPYEFPV